MIRRASGAVQSWCGGRAFTYEPYASSYYLSCHYSSAKEATPTLPRLPVPKLTDTLTKYLKTVRPHLSDEEFAVTSKVVKDFASEGGIGQKLQKLLETRAQQHTNWLEEWWLSNAYLGYRDPVVVFSSPGLVFPFRKFANQDEQLQYAAKTLSAAMQYKKLIDNDEIPQEMMGKNPLDMSQYKKIFGTCRVPAPGKDRLSYNNTQYVTVMHNNHIFHVDLWGDDNKMLSENQIVAQLKKVIQQSGSPAQPVGILTSENRDTWATAYNKLIEDESNKRSLEDIERSLVILCLDAPVKLWSDPAKTYRQNLAAAQTIHGGGSTSNGGNRWFDKTVQFIVGADGITGLTYEHSPAEGQPIAVLTDFLINYVDKNSASSTESSSSKEPRELKFNLDSSVTQMIDNAKTNLDKLAADLELNCFTFDKYGKNFIKSQKMSPDSFLQMAMQFAFYSVHERPGAHYESAATRMYAGGRTETIRSCSPESVAFARAMRDPAASATQRVQAMRTAVQAHKDYTAQALQGFGVDRHLLGLKLIAMENGIDIPKLYSDPGYVKSSTYRISTSQVACKADGFMCYGPLVRDGYATCYNPRAADVNFATSSFRDPASDLAKYRKALCDALTSMHDVLLQATPSKL